MRTGLQADRGILKLDIPGQESDHWPNMPAVMLLLKRIGYQKVSLLHVHLSCMKVSEAFKRGRAVRFCMSREAPIQLFKLFRSCFVAEMLSKGLKQNRTTEDYNQ